MQRNTGISISLRFSKTSAYKKVQVVTGDEITKAYGAPSSWRMRENQTDDDELAFVPPTPAA
jgi:hypothetical protein